MDSFAFLDTSDLTDGEITLRLDRTVEGDPERNWVPAYHFAICDAKGTVMGGCDLRVGYNENTYYGGNIGYHVDPPFRGHHYATKACRLLFRLARRHGMPSVWITCDPDNAALRRTCETLGGTLLEVADIPEDHPMRLEGKTKVCIFRFEWEN